MLGDAYAKKNDLNHAVEAWTKLIAAYPKDVALVSTVVNKIGQSGQGCRGQADHRGGRGFESRRPGSRAPQVASFCWPPRYVERPPPPASR